MSKTLKARSRFRARLESWKGHKGIRHPAQHKPSRHSPPVKRRTAFTLKERSIDSMKPGEYFILRQAHADQDAWWINYDGFLPFMEFEGQIYSNPYKAFEVLTKALGIIAPEVIPKDAHVAKDQDWLLYDIFPIKGVKVTIGVVDITTFRSMDMPSPPICSAPAKGSTDGTKHSAYRSRRLLGVGLV